jgi:HlyD family secretion protein
MSKRTKSIIAVCAAALLLLMILLPALNRGNSNEDEEFEIVSAKVSKGEIVSTVSGSGSLSAGNGLKVSIPQGVRVTKYLVADGDTVSEGQALFEVERASVMQTISLVSNSLDYLKTEIQAAIGAGESKNILAPLYGRVKAVYASVGAYMSAVLWLFHE